MLSFILLPTGKHGISCDGYMDLVEYIHNDCDQLQFAGLMTIGRLNPLHHISGPNPDFEVHTCTGCYMYICMHRSRQWYSGFWAELMAMSGRDWGGVYCLRKVCSIFHDPV